MMGASRKHLQAQSRQKSIERFPPDGTLRFYAAFAGKKEQVPFFKTQINLVHIVWAGQLPEVRFRILTASQRTRTISPSLIGRSVKHRVFWESNQPWEEIPSVLQCYEESGQPAIPGLKIREMLVGLAPDSGYKFRIIMAQQIVVFIRVLRQIIQFSRIVA